MAEISKKVQKVLAAIPSKYGKRKRNFVTKRKRQFARAFRKRPTPAERILWQRVRKKRLGCRIHRQYPIYGYIADFYCPKAKLIIELDGGYHQDRKEYDRKRDRNIVRNSGGRIRILRMPNELVILHIEEAISLISLYI
jgi:very-short-patch-repair endonuclease